MVAPFIIILEDDLKIRGVFMEEMEDIHVFLFHVFFCSISEYSMQYEKVIYYL